MEGAHKFLYALGPREKPVTSYAPGPEVFVGLEGVPGRWGWGLGPSRGGLAPPPPGLPEDGEGRGVLAAARDQSRARAPACLPLQEARREAGRAASAFTRASLPSGRRGRPRGPVTPRRGTWLAKLRASGPRRGRSRAVGTYGVRAPEPSPRAQGSGGARGPLGPVGGDFRARPGRGPLAPGKRSGGRCLGSTF